jgi:molybdate-binding protein
LNNTASFEVFYTSYSGNVDIGITPASLINDVKLFEDFKILKKNDYDIVIDVDFELKQLNLDRK